ncbi:MAG: hypothetical protein JSV92_03880 [archaeon]|nr:MAG: hypothetical protein JSV92_03880 [archaeon]
MAIKEDEAKNNFIKMLIEPVNKRGEQKTVEYYSVSKENFNNLLFEKGMNALKKPEEGKAIPRAYSNPEKNEKIYILVGEAAFVPHLVVDKDEENYIIRSYPNCTSKIKDYPIDGFELIYSIEISEEKAEKLKFKE